MAILQKVQTAVKCQAVGNEGVIDEGFLVERVLSLLYRASSSFVISRNRSSGGLECCISNAPVLHISSDKDSPFVMTMCMFIRQVYLR